MSETQPSQETLQSNETDGSKSVKKEKKEKKVKKEHKEHKEHREHKEKREHRERKDSKTKETSDSVPQPQEDKEQPSEKDTNSGEQPEPGLRRWASRKGTLNNQTANSTHSYKDLVAERELTQRKREQMSDMAWWTKPSQTEILKEGQVEFATNKDGSKKSWDKRWIVLTSRSLLVYKAKKNDTPVCAIVLFSGKVEESTEDKSKKNVAKLVSQRSFTQDTIHAEREYFFAFEGQDEYKDWSEKLFYTCRSAIDPESTITTKARSESQAHLEHDQSWFEKTETGKLAEPNHARTSSVPPPRQSLDANAAATSANDSKQGWGGSVTETIRNSLSIRSSKKTQPADVRGTFRDSSSPRESLTNSATITIVKQPVVIKPALYFNNLIGVSNGVLMLCLENNIEVEKNYVHISWIVQAYITNASNAGSPSSPKKGFKPRFQTISPNSVLPAFATANNEAILGYSAVLKHLCSEYKVSPQWYPEEKKKRDQVDEILDSWGFHKIVLDALKPILYDRIVNPSSAAAQYSFRNLLKDVGRLVSRVDSELSSNKYLAGSEPSVADLAIAGDILMLRFFSGHLDMSKYSNIKRWQTDLANTVKAYNTVVADFEAVVKELAWEAAS